MLRQFAGRPLVQADALLFCLTSQPSVQAARHTYQKFSAIARHGRRHAGFGNRAFGRPGRLQPRRDGILCFTRRLDLGFAPRRAARQIRDLGDEAFVFRRPEDVQWIAVHWMSPYFSIIAANCRAWYGGMKPPRFWKFRPTGSPVRANARCAPAPPLCTKPNCPAALHPRNKNRVRLTLKAPSLVLGQFE